MKKVLLSIATVASLTCVANAGMILDFEAGAGAWVASPSGNIKYGSGATNIDLEKNLGLDTTTNMYYYADFNHFIPLIPNLRVERQDLSISGTSIGQTFTFGGKNFTTGDNIKTDLTMTQNDFIMYWGVPGLNLATAGILDVNFGLDLKYIQGGEMKVGDKTADLDLLVPMGYLNAVVDLPFAPISISATMKQISYQSSKFSDNSAKISYKLPLPLPLIDIKLDAGYKKQSLDISDDLVDDVNAKIDNSGMFFGLSAKF